MSWKPISEAPVCDFDNTYPAECLVWSADIGHVTTGRAWRYADGSAHGQASGFNGDWRITHFHDLPEPPE